LSISAPDSSLAGTERTDWSPHAVYTLGFLTLISSFNYLDRAILGLALPLIKAEMQVSDTVLGLVSGLSFVLFYSLLGIPIAWLADRRSRRNIIAIGFAFWSAMTLATGYVANIWQIAATRFLMGIGEACGVAPSNSMLSDIFRKARRPLVLALFGTAFSLSSLLFFPLLGWIGQAHGWRAMFIAAGAPGVVLAGVFFFTVREPARGGSEERRQQSKAGPLPATLRFLAGSRAYLLLLVGVSFMGANVYADSAWGPTFLTLVHHLKLREVASTIGPIRGVFGGLGILLGGILTDRLGRRDERWRLRLPAIACLLAGPSEALYLLGQGTPAWTTGLALASFFTLVHQGPVYAAAMSVAKLRMRAVSVAVLLLCASLLGQGLGPLLVGALNDMLRPSLGDLGIRYSLLVSALCSIAGGLAFLTAIRYIERDMKRAAEA
jgi:MFS family permease